MAHKLEDSIALLGRTPATLNALLRDLPERWTASNEGDNTWSAFDRVEWILNFGESRAFDPFDRFAQAKQSHGKTLSQLLDEFAGLRSENLGKLRALNLQTEDFGKKGKHPALGVVTLSELLATWAAHDLTHLHQISRIMGYQYRDAVGPWKTYLGVLHCTGHGA